MAPDPEDLLRDTLKTRLMAHAEDLAFDDYEYNPQLTLEQNRHERSERMFRAAVAIAKVFELQANYPPLQVVRAMYLSQNGFMEMVRQRLIIPLIHRHHRNEVERAASVDHQTGLGNVAAFSRARKTALEQNDWFIALDFDNFKAINDTLGHPAGDAALREFAVVLIETLKEFGLASRGFRTGGDEFMVIVSGRQPKQTANHIVSLLRDKLRERLHSMEPFMDAEGNRFPSADFRSLRMGFSSGIAITPELADAALLRAKKRIISIPEQRHEQSQLPTGQ